MKSGEDPVGKEDWGKSQWERHNRTVLVGKPDGSSTMGGIMMGMPQ